ncbi:hypothetical protein H4W00_001769 [Psychrobacter sp. PL19]|uniref:hypothetical protein n=1 Tax=Psychrobacter sp. PL19 TaxID=2760711 RepID=UPI001AE7B5BE
MKVTENDKTAENSKIEIYKLADGRSDIRVHIENDSVWLNRQQLSELFDRDVKTLGKHINNVFKEGELDKEAVVAKACSHDLHYFALKSHLFPIAIRALG